MDCGCRYRRQGSDVWTAGAGTDGRVLTFGCQYRRRGSDVWTAGAGTDGRVLTCGLWVPVQTAGF